MHSPIIQTRKIIGFAGVVFAIAVASAGAEWSPIEKQDGYVVFNYSNLVNLPATHVPARESIAKSLACTLALDEYESIQFGVHAITDGIENVKVQVECDLPVTVYHRISPASCGPVPMMGWSTSAGMTERTGTM